MTETEAKTKWCPMIRTYGGVNNQGDITSDNKCIGSACMMFRTTSRLVTDRPTVTVHGDGS